MARFILLLGVFLYFIQLGWGHKLPQKIREEIQAKREDVDRIISYVLEGPGKHQAFERLEMVTDDFGHRLSGSQALDDTIDFLLTELSDEGLDNVDGEEVMITNWKRGDETLEMLSPRYERMDIMSLGLSPNTSVNSLTAEAIVVTSFIELEQRKDEVPGKIVVYNQPYRGYGPSVIYRLMGGVEASRLGAVAALVRSIAPYSLYTPHTGHSNRLENVEPIPTVSITIEDAELLYRLHSRGKRLELRLTTQSEDLGLIESRNVVAEVQGSELPEELVMFGGHIDSWDAGTGAIDDAGGCIISWQALSIMKALDLQPKRTMRMVMWTGEETGIHGADQYYERHKEEAQRMSLALESDSGTWTPYGIGFTGSNEARAILEEVMELLAPINATLLGPIGGGADINMWEGVPKGSLTNANDDYFFYHHTRADTITAMDADEFDLCAIVWTVVTYVVADLDDMLPRD